MIRWAIVTGEYPPQCGGVSDYSRLVAEALAASGDEVTVYAPNHGGGPDPAPGGARVVRLPDRFGLRGLNRLDGELRRCPPDRLLIQYVPHAFGMKAMNLPFATWVATRTRQIAPVWVMFHEVAFPFVKKPLRHNLVAIVNRMMAIALVGAADRVLVSIPSWGPLLSGLSAGCPAAEWLPVPCNVPTAAAPDAVAIARSRYAPEPGAALVGHFGTFGRKIADLLEPAVVELLRAQPVARALFIGRGSDRYLVDFTAAHPQLSARVEATGELAPAAVAAHLRACDILLQPYADGVSSRRTSVMAGLANQVSVVTNLGALSEPLWAASTGLTVVASPDPGALAAASVRLLAGSAEDRLVLGALGADLYQRAFTLDRTITRLRQARPAALGPTPASHHDGQAHAVPTWRYGRKHPGHEAH